MEPVYDVLIAGAGPAGLTAGIYVARARLNGLLLEEKTPGGSPATTDRIDNYPGFPEGVDGVELMERFRSQAARFGLEMKLFDPVNAVENDAEVKTIHTDEGDLRTRALILATGHKPAKLGVPGEDEFHGRGVSYCATCDGAFFKEKQVMVVGGGNAAVEEAVFLTRFAAKVYLVHRRDRLRASKIVQEKALANPKIEFIWKSNLAEVVGDSKVHAARVVNVEDGGETTVPVDGVFMYVGNQPNSAMVKGLVELDEHGYIVTGPDFATSVPGIFAAGDVRSGSIKQVIVAAGEGAQAAMNAQRYVERAAGTAYE